MLLVLNIVVIVIVITFICSKHYCICFQGENASFAYGLIGAESKFTVTSAGYIVVSGIIDRETKERYHFEVRPS